MHLEELNLLISNCKTPQFFQKILAHELTLKRPAHELKKLNQTLASSTVDLNPHQIDAACLPIIALFQGAQSFVMKLVSARQLKQD